VESICRQIRLTNIDTHLLFAQVGEKLGLLPEQTVSQAFANIYAQVKRQELSQFLVQFSQLLPAETELRSATMSLRVAEV
jgi:hypothetical protein